MTIFEKIDRVRHRRDINLCKPVTQPNTAEVSPAEPDAGQPNPPTFLKQSTTERGILAKSVTPISTPIKLMDHETPAVPDHTEA
jgi:hypothetical protein